MIAIEMRLYNQYADKKILYCGDDDVDQAAVYLSSILYNEKYALDYIPSALLFPDAIDVTSYDLIIFSDYPRQQISDKRMEKIADHVRNGGSFLMIGGWESFTGLNIEYTDSPFSAILPVHMQEKDDRLNYDQGILVQAVDEDHPCCRGLSWERPSMVGGINRFKAKDDSQVILSGRKMSISVKKEIDVSCATETIPLLVTAKAGKGKTAALAFDLAPHWIGGFVDWGMERKKVDFNGGFIEVGTMYYRFVAQLIKSCLKESHIPDIH